MSFLSSLLPIGGALLGNAIPGVGPLLGGMLGSAIGGGLAQNQATNAQTNAANQALGLQNTMFQQTSANLAPYMQAGQGAISPLNAMLGISANPAQVQRMLQADPSYQWRLNQGLGAIMNRRSALGGVLGGNTLRDLNDYAQGAASQEYGNITNRLFALTGLGESAAARQGVFGQAFANNSGDILGQLGQVQSAGIMGQQDIGQTLGNNWLLANLMQQRAASQIPAGWGGSAADPWYG